jgi:general secretion pathway protein A
VYERFFSLRERPFALSPDPDYLYRSRVHSEALSYLRYGIEGHAGFIVVTGEIGSGKTTLLQTALRGVDKHTAVARVVNTQLDARDLVEAVMLDFGLSPEPGLSKPRLLRVLAEYLVQQRVNGRLALLVIDEAQNLSLAALEEIRMLSNLETEKSKLIQIALIGQPELRAMLNRPELEQLRQRVTVSYHLPALDVDETAAYINHRLSRAATGTPVTFPREVTDLIHQRSRGVPRRINIVADAILLYGYGEGQREITMDLAVKAVDELITSGILNDEGVAPGGLGALGAPGALDAGALGAGALGAQGATAVSSTVASASPSVAVPAASASPSVAVPAAIVNSQASDREERVIAALQRLLAEQNHLLQEYRQQLAALIERASRLPAPAPVVAGQSHAAPVTVNQATAASQAAPAAQAPIVTPSASRPQPLTPSSARVTAPPTPQWTPKPIRPLHTTQVLAESPSFWSRLGRGFFSSFSPAYKE